MRCAAFLPNLVLRGDEEGHRGGGQEGERRWGGQMRGGEDEGEGQMRGGGVGR